MKQDSAWDDGMYGNADSYSSMPEYSHESDVNHARVDFSRFRPLTAKIDSIVISCRQSDLAGEGWSKVQAGIKDGLLEKGRIARNWNGRGKPHLTVHDPSLRDLQFLVGQFWNSYVLRIEIAVDAHLPPGSNDLSLLEVLKGQLRHSLYGFDSCYTYALKTSRIVGMHPNYSKQALNNCHKFYNYQN